MTARRAVVGAVGQFGIRAFHSTVTFVARHLLGVAQVERRNGGGSGLGGTPGIHGERTPFCGETRQTVGTEDVRGELVADGNGRGNPLVVSQRLNLIDEASLDLIKLCQLLVRPILFAWFAEECLFFRLLYGVANVGRSLQRNPLTSLIDVEGVTSLETRGPRKFGGRDSVVERHPVADEVVAWPNAGIEEPPFVASKDPV